MPEAGRALHLRLPCHPTALKAAAGRSGWKEIHNWLGPPRFPDGVEFDRLLQKQWQLPDGSVQTLEAGLRGEDAVVVITVAIARIQGDRLLPHTTWSTTPTQRAIPRDTMEMTGFR